MSRIEQSHRDYMRNLPKISPDRAREVLIHLAEVLWHRDGMPATLGSGATPATVLDKVYAIMQDINEE